MKQLKELVYRVTIEVSRFGQCKATLDEYPDYELVDTDVADLIARVDTEVREYLKLKSISKATFKPPIKRTESVSEPGYLFFYTSIPAVDDKWLSVSVQASASHLNIIDDFLSTRPEYTSRSQFIMHACLQHIEMHNLSNLNWENCFDYLDHLAIPFLPNPAAYPGVYRPESLTTGVCSQEHE